MSEQADQTIIDMTQCIIIQGNIPDDLWPEVVLAVVEVKNLRPTSALQRKCLLEALEKKLPRLDHLRVLRATVYVFIHEKKDKKSKANLPNLHFVPEKNC